MDSFRKSLRLQLVRKLPEFVEIDARPESEGVGDRFGRQAPPGSRGLPEAGADCSVGRFLEGNAELARAPLQQLRKIVVERKSRAHEDVIDAKIFDVKTSTQADTVRV